MNSFVNTHFHEFVRPYVLVLIILLALFIIASILLVIFKKKLEGTPFLFVAGLGFSFLGLTIGILVGNSRESAVNTCITASLTLLGAFIAYLYTKEAATNNVQKRLLLRNNLISMISLLLFPPSLLYGTVIGSENRVDNERSDIELKTSVELQVKNYEAKLRVAEDSINAFLEIYKDSVIKSHK